MGLKEYVLRRLVDSTATFLLIFILNFLLFYSRMPECEGLPIWTQFHRYLTFVFLNGFGTRTHPDTMKIIVSKLPITLLLLGLSTLLAIFLGITFGAIASWKRGKVDILLTICLLVPYITPSWWLALLFIALFHPWFPIHGWRTMERWISISPWSDPIGFTGDVLWHLALPASSLTLSLLGIYFLVTRNNMLNVSAEDYVTTARAKGVNTRSIIFRHILRNAILPITTVAALTPLLVVNETISVETVFAWSGIGRAFYSSMVGPRGLEREGPLPILQAIFLILAALTIAGHFVLDIVHHVLDPRIRFDGGQPTKKGRKHEKKLRLLWARFKKGGLGLLGLFILLSFGLLAALAPFLPLPDPGQITVPFTPQPPSSQHWLGTDEWGRDVLSRLIWGARVTLFECIGALLIAVGIGCVVGLLSGYYGGRWHAYLLDRTTDVFLSMPLLMFVIFFPMEPGPFKWVLATGLATWGITGKLVRSQVLLVKEKPYVEAAKASGASDTYILVHYVLPEVFQEAASSLVYTAVTVIAVQSTLDFFGFRRFTWSRIEEVKVGPILSWGTMLSYGTIYASPALENWWCVLPPGACITMLGLSLICIGYKLAEALNPKIT